jgi:uncharacterized membrane protein YqaE (UPF0057 family)
VSKRRYNKGYYVNVSKAPSNESHANNKKSSEIQLSTKNEVLHENTLDQKTTEPLPMASLVLEERAPSIKTHSKENCQSKNKSSENCKAIAFGGTTKEFINTISKKPEFKSLEKSIENSNLPKKSDKNDTKLILCVIIAIFIPPLGMFLWKQDADIWFIVDLILFLFIFSWFYWGGPGLIGLAAIVIALFRIFDLI